VPSCTGTIETGGKEEWDMDATMILRIVAGAVAVVVLAALIYRRKRAA
jgi:hypothetical protein